MCGWCKQINKVNNERSKFAWLLYQSYFSLLNTAFMCNRGTWFPFCLIRVQKTLYTDSCCFLLQKTSCKYLTVASWLSIVMRLLNSWNTFLKTSCNTENEANFLDFCLFFHWLWALSLFNPLQLPQVVRSSVSLSHCIRWQVFRVDTSN